jgi:hypothetical protein
MTLKKEHKKIKIEGLKTDLYKSIKILGTFIRLNYGLKQQHITSEGKIRYLYLLKGEAFKESVIFNRDGTRKREFVYCSLIPRNTKCNKQILKNLKNTEYLLNFLAETQQRSIKYRIEAGTSHPMIKNLLACIDYLFLVGLLPK